jgi:NAD(P)-dependent dehydrogenase (short-subunit alcohol dehydrogenase family)
MREFMGRLSGKVAIITGGASGIGRGTVELFVKEGASEVMADLQDDKGARLIEDLGREVSYIRTDVSSEENIKAMIAHALDKFGRLDCLFNNAGIPGLGGPIANIPTEEFDTVIAVLLRSVFFGIKHAAPVMCQQKSGSIISTASVAGIRTGFGSHVYSAAKAAVIQLTKSTARELGESNVRVNCICPGGIATPIFGKGLGLATQVADQTIEPMKMLLENMQPIPRAGIPADIAQAALWLASDESSFVTGHELVVDGGVTLGRRWSGGLALRQNFMAALGINDNK